MKRFLQFVILIVLAFILSISNGFATDDAKPCFVDLDGDGFNDNATDENSNNASMNSTSKSLLAASDAALAQFMNRGSTKAKRTELSSAARLSDSDRFLLRRLKIRSLSLCRSDFDASAGGASQMKSGSSSGGSNCSGGICRP
ncbi:MAG: hypothetical protein V3T31_12965 [candidate division Zixibacteria bacterium]